MYSNINNLSKEIDDYTNHLHQHSPGVLVERVYIIFEQN